MPPAGQIRGPVYKYLAGFKGRMKSLEDTYLAVFFPLAMGKSDDYVVGRESDTGFSQAVYKQNAGFDSKKTGVITRGDIVGTIRAVFNAGKSRPRIPVPGAPLLSGGGVPFWALMLGVVALTAAGVAYSLKAQL